MSGTLGGVRNSGDVNLMRGDSRTIECDLLPTGAAILLGGYWKVSVNGKAGHIVSLDLTNGRAMIRPPRNSPVYDQLGRIKVICQYYSFNNESLIQFVHNVTTLGECDLLGCRFVSSFHFCCFIGR